MSGAGSFYVTGGTMRLDARSYVARDADEELFQSLQQGEFCYVLTCRQMGKSSLMVRTAARLRVQGVSVALLDVTGLGQTLSPEQWYLGLLARLGGQLGCGPELRQLWDAHPELGPVRRWFTAVEQVLLLSHADRRSPVRLVLFVDEIDAVRSLPFSTDEFFAAIRECHNRRADEPALQAITFCLLGVATPAELIRDPRTTPFNIGHRIELRDFTSEEARPLVDVLTEDPGCRDRLLQRVLYWTGGHPYLVQRLCRALAETPARAGETGEGLLKRVDGTCERLFLSAGGRRADDNLLHVRECVLRSEGDLTARLELLSRASRGVRLRDAQENPHVEVLCLSGAVRLDGMLVRVRNRIYKRVFDRRWVLTQTPGGEVRRQRAAFRRGLLRASAAAALVVTLVGGFAARAVESEAKTRRLAVSLGQALEERDRTLGALRRAMADREKARQHALVQARNARQAEQGERRHRQQAERSRQAALAASGRAREQQRVAERFRLVAVGEREENRRRLVRAHVSAGVRQAAEGDPFGALLRYVEALRIDPGAPAMHRLRIGSVLTQAPRLLFTWSGGQSTSAAFSPDGSRVLVWSGSVGLLRATSTGQPLGPPLRHPAPVKAGVFSSEGSLAALYGAEWATVWDVATGRPLCAPIRHRGEVLTLALSAHDSRLATSTSDSNIQLWDPRTGQRVGPPLPHTDAVWHLAFSPDGQRLAAADIGGVRTWNLRSGGAGALLRMNVSDVSFTPDGRRIVGKGWNSMVWDAESGALLSVPFGAGPCPLALSGDGTRMLTGDESSIQTVELAPDGGTGPALRHPAPLLAALLSRDGREASTLTQDATLRVWDTSTARLLSEPVQLGGSLRHAGLSADGTYAFTVDLFGTGRLWSITTHGLPSRQLSFRSPVPQFRERAPFDAAVAGENAVVWDLRGLPRPGIELHHGPGVEHAAVSGDGKFALTVGERGEARWWRLGRHPSFRSAHIPGVVRLEPASVGHTCVAFFPGSAAQIFDMESGRPLSKRLDHANPAESPFSSRGDRLFALHRAGVSVYERTGDRFVRRRRLSHENVYAVVEAPSASLLVTAGSDSGIRVWDLGRGTLLRVFGGLNVGSQVALSPDGRLLATGGNDGSARLWELASGREVTPPMRHSAAVGRLAFDTAGRLLVTCSGGAVQVWDVKTGEAVSLPDATFEASRAWFAGAERALYVVGPAGLALKRLPECRLGVDALQAVAQTLSARRLDDHGRVVTRSEGIPPEVWVKLAAKLPPPGTAAPRGDERSRRAAVEECERRGQWAAAASHLDWLVRFSPDSRGWYERRGRARAELKRWQDAAEDFRAALRLGGSDRVHWYHLALCYLQAGDPTAYARTCTAMTSAYRQAADHRDRDLTAWVHVLGRTHPEQVEGALELVQGLLAEQPHSASYLGTRGALLFRAGRLEEARQSLTSAIRLADGEPLDHLFLARVEERLGNHQAAQSHWLIARARLKQEKDARRASGLKWDTLAEIELLFREGGQDPP